MIIMCQRTENSVSIVMAVLNDIANGLLPSTGALLFLISGVMPILSSGIRYLLQGSESGSVAGIKPTEIFLKEGRRRVLFLREAWGGTDAIPNFNNLSAPVPDRGFVPAPSFTGGF